MNYKELTKEIHNDAIDRGWWTGTGNRDWHDHAANFHAEVSEAWEEWRNGKDPWEVYYSGFGGSKPEGIPIELADVCIRIMDTLGKEGVPVTEHLLSLSIQHLPAGMPATFAELIGWLHRIIDQSSVTDLARLVSAIALCEKYLGWYNVDLLQVIRIKVDYNKTRPHRHGGKRA